MKVKKAAKPIEVNKAGKIILDGFQIVKEELTKKTIPLKKIKLPEKIPAELFVVKE